MVAARYQAVVFDLFGTLIRFTAGPDPGMAWLREPFAAVGDAALFARFRQALGAVSADLAAQRSPDHVEVPSRERFRRALERIGAAEGAAEMLSLAHMRHLASVTDLPPAHRAVLDRLAGRCCLGLVSNFDHAPTAQLVLARHGIHRAFDVTLVSDDFGRRKPHPDIFAEALARLGVGADQALYVGDTHADDVVGALAAGLDVAWLAPATTADREPRPTHRIAALDQVAALVLG